ncbi:MAG: inorganic diphosphatase [Gemmatimonadales bacterium]
MPLAPRSPVHLWHDVPTGANPPTVVNALIEIPKNDRNKYELDKELGIFRLDRILHSAVHYPGDYGFLPRTLAEDNDPLDILVAMTERTFTGCLIEVRPVGVFYLIDKNENDEKILAVPVADPWTEEIHDLDDLPAHTLREIEHFFLVYKELEGARIRQQESRGFGNRAAAGEIINQCMARYVDAYRTRKPT